MKFADFRVSAMFCLKLISRVTCHRDGSSRICSKRSSTEEKRDNSYIVANSRVKESLESQTHATQFTSTEVEETWTEVSHYFDVNILLNLIVFARTSPSLVTSSASCCQIL